MPQRHCGQKATQLPTPISWLPLELIDAIILQCCATDEADKDMDKKALLATSLVSHLWRAVSLRYLFREITITSHRPSKKNQLTPFIAFLKRSPHLQSYIVKLKLEQDFCCICRFDLPKLHDRDVTRIMGLLPKLGSLSIELAKTFGFRSDDDFRAIITPGRKFVINHLTIRRPNSPGTIARYLLRFSKVKTLKIFADRTRCTGTASHSTLPPTLEVESLEVSAYSLYLNTLRPMLKPSSLTALALYVTSRIDAQSLSAFLETHVAHLQSFKYVTWNSQLDITVLGGSCLSTCTQLRTIALTLRQHVVPIPSLGINLLASEWNACIELIVNAPAELEHVAFTIPVSKEVLSLELSWDEAWKALTSLPWTSIKDAINKLRTLVQLEVILVTAVGSIKTEDVVRIQEEVRSKLGENVMKKLVIRAGAWEDQDAGHFDFYE